YFLISLPLRRPPISPPFPSTTLSRSRAVDSCLRCPASVPRRNRGFPTQRLGLARWELPRRNGTLSMPATDAPTAIHRPGLRRDADRKSTRLNSSHVKISYAVFCLKKK